ncbi:MAG: hypothetical protein MSH25_10295 [Desulfovibrio sp.]|uniref:hypothetical protein n=1 Tax=Desulfovibrio sp. TaxID=885 RepID=UPI0025BE5993|nr:hypothetical protein [Desulfovibrio sp.]MCI7569729.1 hypothetical protein [Desulfovibrio sp.]
MNEYRLAYLRYMEGEYAKQAVTERRQTARTARKPGRPARRFGKLRALARRPKGGR